MSYGLATVALLSTQVAKLSETERYGSDSGCCGAHACGTVPCEDLLPAAVLDEEGRLSVFGEGDQSAVTRNGGLGSVLGVRVQLPDFQVA